MKYRIGLFGASSFLGATYLNEINNSGLFSISGLASQSVTTKAYTTSYYPIQLYNEYDELIDKGTIDVAYISVSNDLHFSIASRLIKNGIHCIIEKPMVGSLDQYNNLRILAQENDVVFFENFCFLYHKQFNLLKNIIASRVHGDIRAMSIRFGFPEFTDKQNFRYHKSKLGGAFRDAGVYIYRLAAQFIDTSSCISYRKNHHLHSYEVDMSGACLIYDDKFSVLGSWGLSNFYQCEVDVWFQSARLVFPRFFTAKPNFKATASLYTEMKVKEYTFADNQYINSLKFFCGLIQDKEQRTVYVSEMTNYYNLVGSCLEQWD